MAIAIPHVYDSGGMQFALAYWAARILLWLRYVPQYRPRVVTSLRTERHRDRADARRRSAVARHVA